MARAPKLKVYRTPIGFHDAYVAAPSQKAALEAWGADKNLFARGDAEIVEDAALTAEPLAAPGTVIKRLRGTSAEQIAALPPDPPQRTPAAAPRTPAPPPRRTTPKPSRDAVDAAERALQDAEQAHDAERRALAEEEAALAARRQRIDAEHEAEMKRLEAARQKAETRYRAAIERWRG